MKKLLISLLVGLMSGAAGLAHAAGDLIKVDGSSTVFPITEAVAEEFGKVSGGTKVMVGISGTGGGFKRFCRGETDISDASRPIKAKEVALCKENNIEYIELPVAYDGLSVMVNMKNTWVDHLTVAELKKIWEPAAQGTVKKWSQVRAGFPDEPITLYGPGTDSGTFDYFTEVINGKGGLSRGDYTASEDDNVLVEGIANDKGALGYFGLAYYEQNKDKLKLIPIDDGKSSNGEGPISPSLKTVMDGTYQPLARPIFIYVRKDAAEKEYIKKFIEYYLKNGAPLVEEVGYIPLTDESYEAALHRFNNRMGGSVFAKETAGRSMVEILKSN
ncbi:MAG: PstS family phosphate ABC transporter substrate-binding protein [Candidatus Omnitrophota bacterium]|nr:PstS family phosphate ABC transporter substrate-binding protein [Candidatus Omnitrophota bacterium]MDZ4243169.1 PstS family phosphate ABC transporter substrate-binding protein [Candidatus Omnitrophota bacterium]